MPLRLSIIFREMLSPKRSPLKRKCPKITGTNKTCNKTITDPNEKYCRSCTNRFRQKIQKLKEEECKKAHNELSEKAGAMVEEYIETHQYRERIFANLVVNSDLPKIEDEIKNIEMERERLRNKEIELASLKANAENLVNLKLDTVISQVTQQYKQKVLTLKQLTPITQAEADSAVRKALNLENNRLTMEHADMMHTGTPNSSPIDEMDVC